MMKQTTHLSSTCMRFSRRVSNIALLCAALFFFTPIIAHSQNFSPDEIATAWQKYQSEILSASVTGTFYRRGGSWPADYSADDVRAATSDCYSQTGVDFQSLISNLVAIPKRETGKHFSKLEFTTSGRKKRTQIGIHTYLFDGGNDITANSANRSVVIVKSEDSPASHLSIDSFRSFPNSKVAKGLAVVSKDLETILAESESVEVELEAETFFPRLVVYKDAEGNPRQIVRQMGTVSSESGIIFPKIRIMEKYRNNVLYSLSVFEIESLTLNGEIPVETFEMKAELGTGVFDYRGSSDHPRYKKTGEDVDNVIKWLIGK